MTGRITKITQRSESFIILASDCTLKSSLSILLTPPMINTMRVVYLKNHIDYIYMYIYVFSVSVLTLPYTSYIW